MTLEYPKGHVRSSLSHILHWLHFHTSPATDSIASLVISIDVDVGSPVGIKGNNIDTDVHNVIPARTVGKIESHVIPILLKTFNEVELPVTFALRGSLLNLETSIPEEILNSNVNHEIASHGYSHRVFTSLSKVEAEEELIKLEIGLKKLDVVPKSFVFPKNMVNHLQLLEKYGYLSYRGSGGFLKDEMNVKQVGDLFDVRPSLYLGHFYNSRFLVKLLNLAVMKRRVMHFWFHPWNLGSSKEIASMRINKVLLPVIKYAKTLNNCGKLHLETMGSIAEKQLLSKKC